MKKVKKYGFGCLMLAAVSAMLVSCKDEVKEPLVSANYPSSVTLEVPADLQQYIYTNNTGAQVLPLIKGETAQLSYSMTPENVTYPEVTWTSGDEKVASVDESGLVTAIAAGYSIVQVAPQIAYAGSGLISVIRVEVSNSLVAAQSITIAADTNVIYAGETAQLTADILPATATYRTVRWSSSNENIATVDMNGVVTGVTNSQMEADVTITATSLDGANVTAQQVIKVMQVVAPTDITLDQTYAAPSYLCAIGDKKCTIDYTTVPASCTKSLIQWTSSDENIATVNGGVVTFNQSGNFGNVTITATCPETGNSSSIMLNLAEGLIRELYHDENNITWDLTAAHKSNGGSSVWSDGKLRVTTYTVNATTQRGDFSKVDPIVWLNATNYPILALRMTDVLNDYAADGVTARNINVDSNTSDGTYKGSLGGGNNKWLTRYKLDDDSYVFIYDLASQTFATGDLLVGTVPFTTFQWKYADIKTIDHAVTYDVYWVQTFKTTADVQAYVAAEGRTIVE